MRNRIVWLFLAAFLCHTGAASSAFGETPILDNYEAIPLPLKNEPIAVFTEHKTLWLVLANTAPHLSPESLYKPESRLVTGVKLLPSPTAQIFMFSLIGNLYATTQKSDTGIDIILHETPVKPVGSSALSVEENAAKRSVMTVATKSAKNILAFVNPNTGETVETIPLAEPGNGFFPSRSFGKFSLLQSAQGIVIQNHTDDVAAYLTNGNVAITSALGLKLSPDIIEQLSSVEEFKEEDASGQTLFPYVNWKLTDYKNFVPVEMKLFHEVTYGNSESANKARLRLVDMYLAMGLFVEARGMAEDILRSSYKFYRANKVAALRGAALFFMQHHQEAEHSFEASELAGDKEIAMWQALCKETLGDGDSVFDFADNYDRYINKYPPVFIQKLALIAADYNIKHRNYEKATEVLDIITRDNLDEPVRKYVDYMRAEIFSETKNEDEAAKIWEKQVAESDDRLIRASAGFSLINMQIREDKITPEKAIKELEKLRIVWRGDDLELSILTLLGSLYIDQKNYPEALRTLHEIVLYYPEAPQTLATAEKMEEIFTMLYNKGGADSMPALDALALFYEFRDLVPVGKDGDMMIRNLAERLVNIDLLDRAEMLLDHQVQKRLQGYERSRVGARLAAIYLQNHQTKEALNTLKTTGYGDLPADLQLTRQRLTARALAAEGHPDKAIEVLNNDNSAEGTLLRLSVYWGTKDWPNVTQTAEEILSNRTDPTAPLTREESGVLLKLATAYVYQHDSGQIQYLRDYFTPLLKDNPDKESFQFITSESGTTDYTNVSNVDSDITTVKSFVDNARAEAKKGVLK